MRKAMIRMSALMTGAVIMVCCSVFAEISISPDSKVFDWQGGDAAVKTTGTGEWSASTENSWITISPRTSGSCGESCIYTVKSNDTLTNRVGKIIIDYHPQHPVNDVAWGLTWWKGLSFNTTNRWDDTNMVNDVLATGLPYRDAGLRNEPNVSTYWGRTESVWFKVTELNLLNRLFDLDDGAGSIYINTSNKVTLQYGDEIVVTDYTISQGVSYELLIISGASESSTFTPGATTHLNEIYIGRLNGSNFINIYSRRSSHMMLVSNYGHTTLPSANYITSGETSQGAYSYWNRVLSAEEIQNHSNLGMVSPDVASHELYQNLFCYCSGENRVAAFSNGYRICGMMPQKSWSSRLVNGEWVPVCYDGKMYRDRNGLIAGAISGDIEPYSVPCVGLYAWGLGDNGRDNLLEMEFIPCTDEWYFEPTWASYRSRANYGAAFKCLDASADSATVKTNATINIWCKDLSDDNSYYTAVKTNKFFEVARAASSMWTHRFMGEYSDKRAYWDKPSSSGAYRPIADESEFGIWIIDNQREKCKSIFVKEKDNWHGPFEIPIRLNDEWGMITLSYGNGLLTLYVNGQDIGNCATDSDWKYIVPSLWCAYGKEQYNPGHLGNLQRTQNDRFAFDEIEVFSKQLTSQEIRDLYALEYQQPLVHGITQSGREATLSKTSCKVSADATNVSVRVTLPRSSIGWRVENLPSWLSYQIGNESGKTKTVTFTATQNNSVYPRTQTVLIAKQEFVFEQDGVPVEIDFSDVGIDQSGGRRTLRVSLPASVQWTADSDVSWITIMSGSSGTGSGTVSFFVDDYSENKTRIGTITIAGQAIPILQRGFSDLTLTPNSLEVECGTTNTSVRIAAYCKPIYAVSYASWITLQAVPTLPTQWYTSEVSFRVEANQSKQMRVGYINISGTLLEVSQKECHIVSIIDYVNLKGGAHDNPLQYTEGETVTFTPAYGVTGYMFSGWTPSQITTDMTGAQTVRAAWTANGYSIAYNPNGGSGTMEATAATYDSVTNISANGFTYAGHVFAGWATNETGEAVYAAGQTVSNLTSQSSGVVTLYAVWEDLVVAAPVVAPGDGTVFAEESCTVTLSCATEGADIYYNIGSAPRATSRYLYSGPFAITDTAEIYAFAQKDGINSDPVTKVIITRRSLTLAEAAGAAELTFTTGGDASWIPVGDATTASGLSARSGMIGDDSETWIQTSVVGAGTFSFNWKVDCEEDYIAHEAGWDHLGVSTNGANGAWIEISRIDGASGWQSISITFADAGTHTIRWAFVKDSDQEEEFADLAWLSGVVWAPDGSPFPEVATNAAPEAVAAALLGVADTELAANITDGTNYNAFCEWAARVKGESGSTVVGAQAVKASTKAWLSYALGADRLISKEPTSDDVKIESFTPSSTDGRFEFMVSVKDVNIGGGSVVDVVLKENLKKVLGIEGAATLNPAEFSSDNIDITFDALVDGKAKFSVSPPADAGNSFFMRVKVK